MLFLLLICCSLAQLDDMAHTMSRTVAPAQTDLIALMPKFENRADHPLPYVLLRNKLRRKAYRALPWFSLVFTGVTVAVVCIIFAVKNDGE